MTIRSHLRARARLSLGSEFLEDLLGTLLGFIGSVRVGNVGLVAADDVTDVFAVDRRHSIRAIGG